MKRKDDDSFEAKLSLITARTANTTLATSHVSTSSSSTFSRKLSTESLIHDPYERLGSYQRSNAKKVCKHINCIRDNPYEITIQIESFEFLAGNSFDEYYCVVIGSSGGVGAILNSMNNHPNDPQIQAYGCITLGNLCMYSLTYKIQMGKLNAVASLFAAMKTHPLSPTVQSSAYFALGQLTTMNVSLKVQSKNIQLAQDLFQAALSDSDSSKDSESESSIEK